MSIFNYNQIFFAFTYGQSIPYNKHYRLDLKKWGLTWVLIFYGKAVVLVTNY